MDFIDNTGNVFSLENYTDCTGYELKENRYVFWIDNPIGDFNLSVNTYYIKQITPYINNINIININNIISINIQLVSDLFSLIKYNDITGEALTIDLNDISDLKNITYNKGEFIIDNAAQDIIAPFFVITKSPTEGTFTSNALITVTYDDGWVEKTTYCVITIGGVFSGEDEKYSVNMSNFGLRLPKEIINAVYSGGVWLTGDTQTDYNGFDFALYNAKLREYLLYNKNLKNNKGNYNSIKSHLDWFGWGADIVLTKLCKTDNKFLEQYLDRDYSSSDDKNTLISRFASTALVNITVAANEIAYENYQDETNNYNIIKREEQDWNNGDLAGEGVIQTSGLFDKYVPVNIDNNNAGVNNFQYLEPFYKYSLNTILIKLAFLKYYYKKYFLPVHVDTLHASVSERCFIPDIKMYTAARHGFTAPMLLNADDNYVLIGDASDTVFLSKTTCHTNDCFLEFTGYREHANLETIINSTSENLYEIREMHAAIPLEFYKNTEEYFNKESRGEDNDYIYNINIILSKYNNDLNRFTSVFSKTTVFSKSMVGNTRNFIIIPNINGTNHDTTWYDSKDNLYRLDVCSNGSWFSKTISVNFPPFNFNLGYLHYTYQTEEEIRQGVSPFSVTTGEAFMREPGLVTVDNIRFTKDSRFGRYITHTGSTNQDYINLYKDNYNIPGRETNPELYNVIMYFDYKDINDAFTSQENYNHTVTAFKENIKKTISYGFCDLFDFYIMYQPDVLETSKDINENISNAYVVLISKQTSSDEGLKDIETAINALKEKAGGDDFNEFGIRFITYCYRFLINRYTVEPYNDNIIDTNKILTCSVSSVYEINVPFNLETGLKWNFTPYSLVNNQAFNVTSKADIALVSIPRHNKKAPEGYYNIFLNYSLNGYETVSVKAPYKILLK